VVGLSVLSGLVLRALSGLALRALLARLVGLPGGGDGLPDRGHDLVLVQMGVPDVQRAHLPKAGHRLAVGGHRGHRRLAGVGLREAVVAGRDREAGRHPLHVVLERPGQRFVEVIEVEEQLALG
jgi:hypothetical protein